jgi:hypothetical protein
LLLEWLSELCTSNFPRQPGRRVDGRALLLAIFAPPPAPHWAHPPPPPPARDFHENKIARLSYVDPSTEYARTLRHLQASDVRWRAEKNRARSYAPGTQGVGGSAGGYQALWRRPPAPVTQVAGARRGRPPVSASPTERAAATHRSPGVDA